MNKKESTVISFFLILNFIILFPSSTVQAQQIPISAGDTIEGQARNKKDIAHVNPIVSVRFIEALTPYLPINTVFMPQTFRIQIIFKTPPKGQTQPIVLSKINPKTGKTEELFEASLIPEGISLKTFITNPIGIKDAKSNWSPAEPYAFPLIIVSPKDIIQAVVGNQKALVETSNTCNFLKMGVSDISEIIHNTKHDYKPWFGKLICSYITSAFKTPKSQADFVKTVLNALSRNFDGKNWTLNSEANISNILILNSDRKRPASQKSNFNIKKTDNKDVAEENLTHSKHSPLAVHIESSLFNSSSKTMNEKLVKAEKAILTIFGFKKASDMGIDFQKIENQREDTKRTILKSMHAFKKEHLLKLNDNLFLAKEKK